MEYHIIVYVVAYSDTSGRAMSIIALSEFVLYRVTLFLHWYCSAKLIFVYNMDK